jgi:broad specificity phosphatase PhoE
VEAVILARHGESVFSRRLLVNGDAAVPGPLTPRGVEEAEQLGRAIAGDSIDVCVTTEFDRTRQTADVALSVRDVPRVVVPELNDPLYGDFEGGALEDYRGWADGAVSSDEPPGGGEARRHIVERYVRGFRRVLSRTDASALVVAHSLPIAYVLAALDGAAPAPRVPLVRHAHPYRLRAGELERAVAVLESWCVSPTW